MIHTQNTIRLAVAAALAAGPLAAQDTTRAGAGRDTGAVAPRMDPARLDTAGVETGAVDTAERDTAGLEGTGYDTGVVRADPGAGRAGGRATAAVTFINRDGRQVGTGTLVQTDRGVLITADLGGLPAGEHAFHVHQTGRCDAPSFESAGDHYAPVRRQHGFLANGGPHAGDMTNVQVVGSTVKVQEFNPFVTLSGGEAPLLDQDGSALILHAKADDYRTQPSGDAGDRIACAIVQRAGGGPQP